LFTAKNQNKNQEGQEANDRPTVCKTWQAREEREAAGR